MATTEYLRGTSFTDAQAANPTAPLSGPGVDAEFDRVKLALDSTQASLGMIQRDDGALKNGIVTIDALAPGVRTGINPATQWVAGTNYAVNDSVFVDDGATIKLYRCLVAHTSAPAFATDLAAVRWLELADYTPPVVVGTIAVADGGTGATTAENARTNLGLGDVAVEDVVPVAKGGTGADNAAAARTNLGATATGAALFTADDAAAARTAIGATATGDALIIAADAAAARSAVVAPARPTGSVGVVGQFVTIFATNNAALVLPSGGTWAFCYIPRNVSTGAVGPMVAGVSAGGATVANASSTNDHSGFAWRVV